MDNNRAGSVFANVGLPPLEYSKVMTLLYLQVNSINSQRQTNTSVFEPFCFNFKLISVTDTEDELVKGQGYTGMNLYQRSAKNSGCHRA